MSPNAKKQLIGAIVAAALAIAVYYGLIDQKQADSIKTQADQTLGTGPAQQAPTAGPASQQAPTTTQNPTTGSSTAPASTDTNSPTPPTAPAPPASAPQTGAPVSQPPSR